MLDCPSTKPILRNWKKLEEQFLEAATCHEGLIETVEANNGHFTIRDDIQAATDSHTAEYQPGHITIQADWQETA